MTLPSTRNIRVSRHELSAFKLPADSPPYMDKASPVAMLPSRCTTCMPEQTRPKMECLPVQNKQHQTIASGTRSRLTSEHHWEGALLTIQPRRGRQGDEEL